jgi:DNA repair protein RecN (Recombination protein N)
MLALKSVLSRADQTPTLVFDEVDVGVGGRSGQVVGEKLSGLAAGHQVVVITHLPQIAACADTQMRVTKSVRHGRTTTEVQRLDDRGRQEELARMMAGGSVSDAVISSAAELLASRHQRQAKGETKPKAKAKVRR